MTWAHAEPFRAAFILSCTSRGWNGAGLVSRRRKPLWISQSCSPVQRCDADLLFRGYSWPVDLRNGWIMTLELTRAGSERFRTDDLHEPRRRGRTGGDETSDPSDGSRRLPVPRLTSVRQWKTEMEALYALKATDNHSPAQGQRWTLSLDNVIVVRCIFSVSNIHTHSPPSALMQTVKRVFLPHHLPRDYKSSC